MPAGEIITQDGRRCTKVRKNGQDATSIFQATSTATGSDPQTTASLTQEALPTSSDVAGESPASFILSSTLSASISAPISSRADAGHVIVLETSKTLSDDFSHELSSPASTEGSGLNLSAGSGNSRPSFLTTPTPDGSTTDTGPGDSASNGDGDERADSQNPAVIAGGIIGAVILIAMIVVAWIYIRRRRRKQRLAESPANINSNNHSAVAVAEKLNDDDPASTRASQLPTTASYSTFATNRGGIPDTSEARNSGTPLVQSEGRPSSQYLESAPAAENQPPPLRTGIGGYAAGILGKFGSLFPSSAAKTQEGYLQPSQYSSARSSYNERTDGSVPQRRRSDSSLPRLRAHDVPMPEMLNPFADPSSTNGVQPSPIWRSPLARNPFEDPAPPDEDFPFPSPREAFNPSASHHQYHESNSSSVIMLPSSAGESVRSVSLDATASEISRWRRDRESQVSTRSDPFDLERTVSVRSNNGRRTTVNNTARSSQHLVP